MHAAVETWKALLRCLDSKNAALSHAPLTSLVGSFYRKHSVSSTGVYNVLSWLHCVRDIRHHRHCQRRGHCVVRAFHLHAVPRRPWTLTGAYIMCQLTAVRQRRSKNMHIKLPPRTLYRPSLQTGDRQIPPLSPIV